MIALLELDGCSQLRGRQGYVVDPVLTQAITPGVDNRESVEKTLGHPSFVSQFSDNEYYYLSRVTRQLALDRKSTRLTASHYCASLMPVSALHKNTHLPHFSTAIAS